MKAVFARVGDWIRRQRGLAATELASYPGVDNHNAGVVRVNGDAALLQQKTVIVLGVPRGGTSMVAGAIAHLGVYMGQTRSSVYEDHALSECFRREDIAAAREIIAERNARYDVWGFKKPRNDLLAPRWQQLFREPVYVGVMRDPLAVAGRRAVNRASDFFEEMHIVQRQQAVLFDFVRRTDRPCLLVSYEKALLDPDFFVRELAAFLGCGNEAAIAAAAGFVSPSPEAYLRVARIEKPHSGARGKWRGHFERIGAEQAVGWAFLAEGEGALDIELYVNGVLRSTQPASNSREDVRERFRLDSDACGFVFSNGEHAEWHAGDVVSVRVAGENDDINNSPQICRV